MKNRGNLLLLAVFFAGLIGLWAADRARIPTRTDRERVEGRVLPALIDTRPEELRRVEISGGPRRIVLERRDGGRWQMTEPLDVAADPGKVENLAFNLKSLAARPESAAQIDPNPGSYGLAPAERTVKLWGTATDAPLATLDVGRASLSRRFVRSGGTDAIVAVDAAALGLVDIDAPAWRDREVFRVPSFEVDAVTIADGAHPRPLQLRRERDAWRITEPVRALADGVKLDGLAADLAALRVTGDDRFVADNVAPADRARYGLDQPSLTITVEARANQARRLPQVLHVGKPVPDHPEQVYAVRGDQDDVFVVDSRVLKTIAAEPSNFRDNRVADIDPRRATTVRIEADGHHVSLARYGNNWMITEPQPARADVPAVAAFFKTLLELRTSQFLDRKDVADAGVDPGAVIIQVYQDPLPGASEKDGSPDGPRLTLRLGRRDAARRTVYARTDDDPRSILALPEAMVATLPRNSLGFRSRLVLSIARDQIHRVVFEGEGKTTVIGAPLFAFDAPGLSRSAWWVTAPVTVPADMDSVERLLKLMGGLRANDLVADHNDKPARWGFDRPLLRVTCSRPPPSPNAQQPPPGLGPLKIPSDELTLVVGKAVPGSLGVHYASILGESLVFTVGGEVLSVFDSEWRDHRIGQFDPALARRITFSWPDRRLELVAPTAEAASTSLGWKPADPADAPGLDLTNIKSLVAILADLRTGRFVQDGGPYPPESGLNPPRVAIQVAVENRPTPVTLRLGKPGKFPGSIQATVDGEDGGRIFLLAEAPFQPWLAAPQRPGELPSNPFAP